MEDETKNSKLIIDFTNQFGDRTKVVREFDMELLSSDSSHLDLLREMFDNFLLAAGFIFDKTEN